MGIWAADHIVGTKVSLHTSYLAVGKTFVIYFKCVDHGDGIFSLDEIMAVEAKLAVMEVDVLLLGMHGKESRLIVV